MYLTYIRPSSISHLAIYIANVRNGEMPDGQMCDIRLSCLFFVIILNVSLVFFMLGTSTSLL